MKGQISRIVIIIILYLSISFSGSGQDETLNVNNSDDAKPLLILSVPEFVANLSVIGTIYSPLNTSGRQKIDFVISKKGKFQFSLNCLVPSEQVLEIGGTRVPFYAIPNDTARIIIKHSGDIDFTIEYASNQEVNQFLLAKDSFNLMNRLEKALILNDYSQTLKEFKTRIDSVRKKEFDFFLSYNNKSPLPEWFYQTQYSNILYDNLGNKLNFPQRWVSLGDSNNYIPNNYYLFTKSIEIVDWNAILSASYYDFLRSYFYYLYEEEWVEIIPDYRSNSFESKAVLRKTHYLESFKFENRLGSDNDIDSLEILYWQNSLRKAEKYLDGNIKEYFAFKTVSTDAYLLPDPSHPAIHSIYYYYSNFQNEEFTDILTQAMKVKFNLVNGQKAPSIILPDLNGKDVDLKDFKGKLILLSFWFPGCKPCIYEIPYERNLLDKFQNIGLEIISVCITPTSRGWKEAVNQFSVPGINLHSNDNTDSIKTEYDVFSFPKYVLIDKNGDILVRNAPRASKPELQALISAYLKSN